MPYVDSPRVAPACEDCGGVSQFPAFPASPGIQICCRGPVVFDMWQSPAPTTSPAFPAFTDSDGFPVSSMPPSAMSTMPAAMPSMPAKQQDITSMLSGLDFTTPAPVEETSPPVEATLEPTPTEEEKADAGDLWSSNMVNLNLKAEDKMPVQRSAKSYQTLEQARQLAPKEKVQVLPTPPLWRSRQQCTTPHRHQAASTAGWPRPTDDVQHGR